MRRRGLFDLAESYCRARLDDAELPDATRAEAVIELARTLAEQALLVRPEDREPILRKAADAIDGFGRQQPQNPRLLLVRLQGALVTLAAGELARQESEIGLGGGEVGEPVRAQLRAAIAQLKQIDDDIAVELRRRNRTTGQLSETELTSLRANVRFQTARAFRNQALCYPADSLDRTNALAQALELLAPLAAAPADDPLLWPARIDQLVSLRLAGKLKEAADQLAELQKHDPPAAMQRRMRAEGVRILLAAGKLNEAFQAAGAASDETGSAAAELDFARLQAIVAQWQKAGSANAATDVWEKRAGDEVRHIEALHGPYWMRRAESLLAGTLAKAARAANLDNLTRAAASFYRGGQIDQALAAYDQAAQQAEDKGQAEQAFDIRYTAGAIENQRKHYQAASQRLVALAVANPEHPKAAEAHLAGIYAAAEAAKADNKPSVEFPSLLEEHLTRWPQAPSTARVAFWLGTVREHEQKWQAAANAFRSVPRTQAGFVEAADGAARCYERLFAAQRAAGKIDPDAVREAARWFEQLVAGPSGKGPAEWTTLEQKAALTAARLRLADTEDGAATAEALLSDAVAHATDAPAEWQTSARVLLVAALAAQGRLEDAVGSVEKVAGGSPADLALMLDELAKAGGGLKDDAQKRKLAELELRTIAALGERTGQLGARSARRSTGCTASPWPPPASTTRRSSCSTISPGNTPRMAGCRKSWPDCWPNRRLPSSCARRSRNGPKSSSTAGGARRAGFKPTWGWPRLSSRSASGHKPEPSSSSSPRRIPTLAAPSCAASTSRCWPSARRKSE